MRTYRAIHRPDGTSYGKGHGAISESAKHFKRGSNDPDFWSKLSGYPANAVVSVHLFKKGVMPGIGVG